MNKIEKDTTLIKLKFIEATISKLADDLSNGRLWPGEYNKAVASIRKTVNELPNEKSGF